MTREALSGSLPRDPITRATPRSQGRRRARAERRPSSGGPDVHGRQLGEAPDGRMARQGLRDRAGLVARRGLAYRQASHLDSEGAATNASTAPIPMLPRASKRGSSSRWANTTPVKAMISPVSPARRSLLSSRACRHPFGMVGDQPLQLICLRVPLGSSATSSPPGTVISRTSRVMAMANTASEGHCRVDRVPMLNMILLSDTDQGGQTPGARQAPAADAQ